LKAERRGVQMRLADAEAALRERAAVHPATPATTSASSDDAERATLPGPGLEPDSASDLRSEQLLADLSETAERLANTEEALAAARDAAQAAERRADELGRALNQMRDELEHAQ